MSKKQYPKILSNIPEGKDLFKAESHKKIAETIINVIENKENVIDKQIIGLEGDWGTGKSNIIKIIGDNSGDNYIHFTYDTWTHQEDLTRKSILEELINFLKKETVKVIDSASEIWAEKENELSQKTISKNTKYFPRIKAYYILLILGFIIIKFGNEFIKQIIEKRVYGFYDNSINYLIDNLYFEFFGSIKWEYILKAIPFYIIFIGIVLFLYSAIGEFIKNKKEKGDKKLSLSQLIGKIFYWVSGEKLESNSNETIKEDEPSNLRFRKFLKDIDDELISKNKTLFLTIDNTDRLTDLKLKNVWSTINIFFAESHNGDFLNNIWLIIPYDEKKVIESFDDEKIGIGLLEKTFAITFKVPPPLSSNWESFFECCFNKSFDKIELNDKNTEIEILIRLFEHYQNEITPRRIINFINQIATYYIQNPKIYLRYSALVTLNKDIFFGESINENIIDRKKYLGNLDSLFIDDEKLELNIAKIIYGVEKDIDAEEALLSNEINNVLVNDLTFDEKLLNTPSFNNYFFKYFKKFLDRDKRHHAVNDIYFNKITRILMSLKDSYLNTGNPQIYKGLWENYYKEIRENRFLLFDDTIKGILIYSSKKSKLELINDCIENILKNTVGRNKDDFPHSNQILYVDFLKSFDDYLLKNNYLSFKDVKVEKQNLDVEYCLDLIKEDKILFSKLKLNCSESDLKSYLEGDEFDTNLRIPILIDFKSEIIFLKEQEQTNLDFIAADINVYWVNRSFDLVDVDTIIYYYLNVNGINIDTLSPHTYISLIDLINSTNDSDLTYVYYLAILNYDSNRIADFGENVKNAFFKLEQEELHNLTDKLGEFNNIPQLINVFKILVDFENLNSIKDFAEVLIKSNLSFLNNDGFNWLLQNYSYLESKLFDENSTKIYDLLNRKAKDFEINILPVDIELINNSSKYLNTELVEKSNNYILSRLQAKHTFFIDANSADYLLFFKLLNYNRVNKEVYENLTQSFFDLAATNIDISHISHIDILKIKSKLNNNALNELIGNNLMSLNNKKNVFLISPEIFAFFPQMNHVLKVRILLVLVGNIDYYNKQLIDEIIAIGDINLNNNLKIKLQDSTNIEIVEYAIKMGIIEPNSN